MGKRGPTSLEKRIDYLDGRMMVLYQKLYAFNENKRW